MTGLKELWKKRKIEILTCGYFLLLILGVGFSMTGEREEVFSLEKRLF
ncbi:MAG: hypothetical protein LUC92_05215 [Clostridiales bacterium]|nr:hypothetical protein [Clostridiales bacterium]